MQNVIISLLLGFNNGAKEIFFSKTLEIIILIFSMSITAIYGFGTSLYAYNPIKNEDNLATRTSTFAFLGFMLKLIEPILHAAVSDEDDKWVRAIGSLG